MHRGGSGQPLVQTATSLTSYPLAQVAVETGSTAELDAHAAATGINLALHKFDWKTSKSDKEKKTPVSVSSSAGSDTSSFKDGGKTLDWATGSLYSTSQNLARELMETPANLMTPTVFAERAKKEFEGLENVTVNIHDEGEHVPCRSELDPGLTRLSHSLGPREGHANLPLGRCRD